jgi:O-acetyl-ADP-ribose deacetylase (regulator of RNase III)
MNIEYQSGYPIDEDVDMVINYANGFLLLGSDGSGRIRDKSDRVSPSEKLAYQELLDALPDHIKRWYIHVYHKNQWYRTYARLSCLTILMKKRNNIYRRGTAVLDANCSRTNKKRLIHAIVMFYRFTESGSKRKKAISDTIIKTLRAALKIVKSIDSKSVALPLMCSRPSYGVKPEDSLFTIIKVLKEFEFSSIQKTIVYINSKSIFNGFRESQLI